MNISSTPFIRNDYWPDYNDIDVLNKRIDEAENETSLVNSRLTNDIENVSNNLNSYKNEMADTVITNNIIVNNLNANYAVGKYANFTNTNTDNAYIENLTVNKPVFDLTLNTPHVENITSIGGNFYDANMFNVAIDNLLINTQSEPITSSAVLGYDSEGRVIPIKAAFEVGFPENANYLFTDQHGTAFPGIAETEVNASDNLITSNAVYNALANVNNSFNDTNNNFANIANNFNDVANELNEANNTINSLQDKIRILSVDDADYYWSGAPVNYRNVTRIIFNGMNHAGTSISGIGPQPTNIAFNSTSNVLEFSCRKFSYAGGYYHPESLTQIFNRDISYLFAECDHLNYVANIQNNEFNFNFCEPTGNFITNMSHTFSDCNSFNQPVQIPDSVTNMQGIFAGCFYFDQNVQIPDSVTDMTSAFYGSFNFNQNIRVPNGVTNLYQTFGGLYFTIDHDTFDEMEIGCPNLNQNILIPNSVTNMLRTFMHDDNFSQNILIPNSVTQLSFCFAECYNFNQNILIPNSVTSMASCFINCRNLNQPNMYIFSQNIEDMGRAFVNCHINNIHIPTSVPKDTSNYMYNCLVNGNTGITFPAANIFNDLPVDVAQWPPV